MVTLIGIISYICFRMPAWYDITSLNEFDREDKSGITSGWHLCYLLLSCCKIGVFLISNFKLLPYNSVITFNVQKRH